MAYPNGDSQPQPNRAGLQPPPSFQLVPHMSERTSELAKIASATVDILRRLRGSQPEPATDKVSKAPESATDFAYEQSTLTRIIGQNVQEISGLIG